MRSPLPALKRWCEVDAILEELLLECPRACFEGLPVSEVLQQLFVVSGCHERDRRRDAARLVERTRALVERFSCDCDCSQLI